MFKLLIDCNNNHLYYIFALNNPKSIPKMNFFKPFYILSLIFISFSTVSCYQSDDVPEETPVDPSEFVQKLLIEDHTGTWCVNCPKAGLNIENAVEDNNRFIPVTIHYRNLINPEEMQNVFSEELVATYNPLGVFPKVFLNRNETIWGNSYEVVNLERLLNKSAPVGLAINSSLTGNNINVNVRVGYVEETTNTDNYKIVVYLLESGMVYTQTIPNGEDENYVHNNVLRYSFTNVLGDVLPNEVASDHRYSKDFTATLPSTIENANNLKIVAFVVDKNNNCLNVEVANVGENKDFDFTN